MTKRIWKTVLAGVSVTGLALVLSGCAGSSPAAVTQDLVHGKWTSQSKGNPYLELDGKGNVTGSDGCNRIATSYTIDNNRVVFAKGLSTLMACEGIDAWLAGLSEASFADQTMLVKDDSGAKIGELERSSKGE